MALLSFRKFLLAVFLAAVGMPWCHLAAAGDWPAYRHDIGRSGSTPEQIGTTLHAQWTHVPRHAPCPAWPEPIREAHLMQFDKAFQVVAAGGMAYFGSSADHQVHAIDLARGDERWHFFTDAPVRFAPQVYEGNLYVASDDGCVYCLSAADGKLRWRFRGAADERMLGNEAMVSRWPLRGGLVVDQGTVYFTAGMWPSEGTHLFALKAADGSVVWKKEGNAAFAPQGYMSATDKELFAPVGRADLKLIDRSGGQLRDGKGMSLAITKGGLYLTGPFTHGANENLPVAGGLPFAERNRHLMLWDVGGQTNRRGRPVADFAGKDVAVMGDTAIYLAGKGKVAAHAVKGLQKQWEVDSPNVFSLALAGSALIVGSRDSVTLLDAANGGKLWSGPVQGDVYGLAVADGRLLASTDKGRIACFGKDKLDTLPAEVSSAKVNADSAAWAEEILKNTGIKAGFCLMAGAGDGQLPLALAKQSDLRIFCAEPDEAKVAAARELLNAAGLYGARVTVHHVPAKTLPYPNYFANLIVVDQTKAGKLACATEELYRVLRPYGGTACLISSPTAEPLRLRGAELQETPVSPGTIKFVRGKLPGAGQWTHLYADPGNSASSGDQLVRSPLKVLWFGKPGPDLMMNRHWRGTAPLFIEGRMFVLGQHNLVALDAYNGRELWSRALPAVARRVVDIWGGSMVGDPETLYVATGDLCLRFDAATGTVLAPYRLPLARPQFSLASPQVIALDALGKVEISNTPEALLLKLTSIDATVTNAKRAAAPGKGDSWELFFDFRAQPQRTGLYGPGAFQVIVVPATKEQAEATCHRGTWSEAPRVEVKGTLTAQGSETLVRVAWADVEKLAGGKPADFNFGVVLNSSDNGTQLVRRTCRFANDSSYRLANCWANMTVGAKGPSGPAGQTLLDSPNPERLLWGNLTTSGDVVLGSVVATKDAPLPLTHGWDFASEGHDYTGPPVQQVLDIIGLEAEAQCIFALDRGDGRPRWTYKPAGSVPHNGIAVGNGRVYLLDKAKAATDEKPQPGRRGQPPAASRKTSLEVLDLATGKRLWKIEEGLERHLELRLGRGVLLATNMAGMTAFDAENGKKLWSVATGQPMHHCSAFLRAPVITGTWVYDEPAAYDLRTGTARTDAAGKPWRWGGFRGCGTVSAGEHMLFFRSGIPGFLDVAAGTAPTGFPGIRPGCYINMIAAGGLALMPEASSGCGCAYNFQTTVTLFHPQ